MFNTIEPLCTAIDLTFQQNKYVMNKKSSRV